MTLVYAESPILALPHYAAKDSGECASWTGDSNTELPLQNDLVNFKCPNNNNNNLMCILLLFHYLQNKLWAKKTQDT